MHIVATAGHVDHGKSTLVRALTGMEPDRWAEERRRGMTIDLGYAWTTLPSGEQLAFVDVPGHERFIGNTLTGLGAAPAVVFVVAADEGWSRQSDEHLAAINALDLRHGLLVVTRCDLADPTSTRQDSLAHLAESSLGAVDSVAVSSITGAGLDDARAALSRLVRTLPPPDPAGQVRFWIDRAFTMRGSGTVVTGTLSAGTIGVGDELQLRGHRVGVRGIQSLGEACDRVGAVARVALNLRAVRRSDVGRGDVLLGPGRWHLTHQLDVRLRATGKLLNGLIMHIGTAALPVHVRTLGVDIARISLPVELPIRAGDRAVLRDPSRRTVAAGVLVLDADPPELSRRGSAARRARELVGRTGPPDARAEIERRGWVRRDHLEALGVATDELAGVRAEVGWLITESVWRSWVDAAPRHVVRWADRNPIEPRMPHAVLVRALELPDDALLDPVLAETDLSSADGRVVQPCESAPGPTAFSLGPAEAGVQTLEERLHANPFDAPERGELAALQLGRRELAAAEHAHRVLRISADVVLLPDAAEHAHGILSALPQPFTTSQARQALDTTRRVAIPLLELLDRTGRTRRIDAQHRTIQPAGGVADSAAPTMVPSRSHLGGMQDGAQHDLR